jgi:glycosyltransferase involved in cell wall biosynthesis
MDRGIKMNKPKTKIHWVSQYKDTAAGNAFGYRTHNDTLKRHVEKIAEITPESKNFFMIMAPEYYKEKYPGTNFLFTMFEGTTIPEKYRQFIDKADYILVPSNWCKKLFDQYYNPQKIFVVNHGVDWGFTFKKRHFPNTKPFRFLYVGAMNPRKGWEEIAHLWEKVFQNNKNIELYIKTTGTKEKNIIRNKNVILDTRVLSQQDLVKVYHESHCFLFPSRGEGFGLTLAEAMRTGLPCIATSYSGQTDFFDEKVGYPIGYKMGKGIVTFIGDGSKEETGIAFPYVDELAAQMANVMGNYKQALKKGENASNRILSKFTWPAAAKKLVDIIGECGEC